MTRSYYRLLILALPIICLNTLFCQHEEKPEKWSDEPHVDSVLTYHFAVVRKVMKCKPWESYSLDTLTTSGLFFEELTGLKVSGTLGPFGLIYQGEEIVGDYNKWWAWCRANNDRLIWDSTDSRVLLRSDSTETGKR